MKKPRISLVWQIMIGLVLGMITGAILNIMPEYSSWMIKNILQPAGDIFIQLMKMIVVPIVFSCLVVGVAGTGDSKSMGRIGIKTISYFLIVTTVAILFGLLIGNIVQPGSGTNLTNLVDVNNLNLPSSNSSEDTVHAGIGKVIFDIIPPNIIEAMSKGKLLSVIFFAVMFGLAIARLDKEKKEPILKVLQSISNAMFNVTSMVIAYSPIGIFGMMAVTITNFGFASLLPLLKLIITTYFACILFAFLILGMIARIVGLNIFSLIKAFKAELILAFSTASSATVLPQLIKKTEQYGAPESISSFVVPTGYSFNLDGAALFLSIGALFIAQLYGIDLAMGDQALLVVTMILTSKGAAGVPGFMFVILSATLSSVGLPLEGIAFIAGVYRLMDMPITTVNVLGNTLAPLVIAKWEKSFDSKKQQEFLNNTINT